MVMLLLMHCCVYDGMTMRMMLSITVSVAIMMLALLFTVLLLTIMCTMRLPIGMHGIITLGRNVTLSNMVNAVMIMRVVSLWRWWWC